MALVLLVGSGLLARSFSKLMGVDLGFDPQHVLTFRVGLPTAGYPKPDQIARFSRQLVDRLSEIPGVEAAGAVTELPTAQIPRAPPSTSTASRSTRPAAADDSVSDDHARVLRGDANRGDSGAGLRFGDLGTACGRSSSTRPRPISTGRARIRWASSCGSTTATRARSSHGRR